MLQPQHTLTLSSDQVQMLRL